MNKKAITPLLATFLLIIFAMLLGSVVMSFGKTYIGTLEEAPVKKEAIKICSSDYPVDPLKELQIRHINRELTSEEYFQLEKDLLSKK